MQKKIIFLGKLPPPYIGPSIATRIILNSSLNKKFRLIHLDLSDHRDIDTLAKFDFMNFYLAFKHYLKLTYYVIRHRPDLVYIPAGQTTVGYIRDSVFIIISKLFRRKVLCHLRGGNFWNWYVSAPRMVKKYVRCIHKKVDGQIVLGENLRYLFNTFLPDDKIFVVPNGGNYEYPEKKPAGDGKTRILYLANFIKTKGMIDVIHAAACFSGNQKVEFMLAGSWNDPDTQKEVTHLLNTTKNLPLTILGPVFGKEKFDLLLSSDIFVFPTYYENEGHPWVIVEAMAAGLPVISTNHAAIPESVIDGINGFLVEKRNPPQIAEKIQYMIDHPHIRKKMGHESHRLYQENFTEEKMIEKLEMAINTVLKSK